MTDPAEPDDVSPDPDRRRLFKLGAGAAAGAGLLALSNATPAAAAVSGGTYQSVTPIRILDTRMGGGPIKSGETRTSLALSGNTYACVCNITVANTTGKSGYLAIYSADLASRPQPFSSVNWQGASQVVANLAIFDTGNAGFKIYCGGGGSTDLIIDFISYFVTAPAAKTPAQQAFEARAQAAARRLTSG